jgi:hypothetical protein
MQAVESQKLILYQTDLQGEWPESAARAFAAELPYARRLALRGANSSRRASLAGIALALRALAHLLGRTVRAGEIVFAHGRKPRLASSLDVPAALLPGEPALARPNIACSERSDEGTGVDFSISHAGPWVACAALGRARVGLDLEMGTDARIADWVMREAALKASGEGLRALHEVDDLIEREGRLGWRGEPWYLRRLEGFAGAAACIVSSCKVAAVESHAVALAELFDS